MGLEGKPALVVLVGSGSLTVDLAGIGNDEADVLPVAHAHTRTVRYRMPGDRDMFCSILSLQSATFQRNEVRQGTPRRLRHPMRDASARRVVTRPGVIGIVCCGQ